ncbi:hypothetical protein CBR_g47997 [Chara braunii]|uniref:Reverse transcriptase domain-containing protein n=1 Tax=Chara braunii TaxID=69332 RepID=A0A388M1S2_CHABU|nr:hypothetical protein CBR_g47997 [Chara braunii]|eukprot:GBG88527.1 hypothetical protein CBR_g47997 [Chara braunii]
MTDSTSSSGTSLKRKTQTEGSEETEQQEQQGKRVQSGSGTRPSEESKSSKPTLSGNSQKGSSKQQTEAEGESMEIAQKTPLDSSKSGGNSKRTMRNHGPMTEEEIKEAEDDQRDLPMEGTSSDESADNEEEGGEGEEEEEGEDTVEQCVQFVEQLEWGRKIECKVRLAHHKHLHNLRQATQATGDILSENRYELLKRDEELNEFYAAQYARKSRTNKNEIHMQEEEYNKCFQWPKSYHHKDNKHNNRKRKAREEADQGSEVEQAQDSQELRAETEEMTDETEENAKEELQRQATILEAQVNALKDQNREFEEATINLQKIAQGQQREIEAAARLDEKNGVKQRVVLPCRWNEKHSDWEVAIHRLLELINMKVSACTEEDFRNLIRRLTYDGSRSGRKGPSSKRGGHRERELVDQLQANIVGPAGRGSTQGRSGMDVVAGGKDHTIWSTGRTESRIMVYCPNGFQQRAQMVDSLPTLLDPARHLIIVGDWNATLDPNLDRMSGGNRQGEGVAGEEALPIHNMMAASDLIDPCRLFFPEERQFTYYKRNRGRQASRIDYFLTSLDVTGMSHAVGIGELPYMADLDHKHIYLYLITEKQCTRGMSSYKLNNSLIQTTELRQAVLQVCLSYNPETQSFLDLMNSLSKATAAASRQLAIKRKRREHELQQAIRMAEKKHIRHASTDVYERTLEAARSELGDWERWRTRGLQLRARVKEWEEGERMTKFFFQKTKNGGRNALIEKLEGPQGLTTSTEGMVVIARNFYSNLYKSREGEHPRQQVERARSKFLVYLEPTISQAQAAKLEAPLSQEELLETLKSMSPNKTPGRDGLTKEFWLEFWPILGSEYVTFLEQAWQREELGQDLATGIVTLLYKKGNPADIRNYRPITLLTLTHKIVVKALANRLRGVTEGCFHLDQTGFIPRRFILDNVMTLTESVRYIRDKRINAAILFFDFEKAYDQVNWSFLQQCMERMGGGPNFRKWIKVLYNDAHGQVQVNDYLSAEYKMSSSWAKVGTEEGIRATSYWSQMVKLWKNIFPARVRDLRTREEVLRQHLFCNPGIKNAQGKPFTLTTRDTKWGKWVEHGVWQIKHLWKDSNRRWKTSRELRTQLKGSHKLQEHLNDMVQAIPQEWTSLLRNESQWGLGDWATWKQDEEPQAAFRIWNQEPERKEWVVADTYEIKRPRNTTSQLDQTTKTPITIQLQQLCKVRVVESDDFTIYSPTTPLVDLEVDPAEWAWNL